MDKFLLVVKTRQRNVKGAKCLPVETGRNRQRRRRTVPNILFSGKYENISTLNTSLIFPQTFSLAIFFQRPEAEAN